MKRFSIITRKEFKNRCSEKFFKTMCDKWWKRFYLVTHEPHYDWCCVFTPWSFFATFFVKSSKYYKARNDIL